jgi:hypothetical protein
LSSTDLPAATGQGGDQAVAETLRPAELATKMMGRALTDVLKAATDLDVAAGIEKLAQRSPEGE